MIQYLLDEHVSPEYRTQMHRHEPSMIAWSVGDPGAPKRGTDDPAILLWCDEHDFVLVTNNRKTMPDHLADRLAEGRHVPGILVLDPDMSFGETLAELILIAVASREDEYRDQIAYMPLG